MWDVGGVGDGRDFTVPTIYSGNFLFILRYKGNGAGPKDPKSCADANSNAPLFSPTITQNIMSVRF